MSDDFPFPETAIEAEVHNAVLKHDVAKLREALNDGFNARHIFAYGYSDLECYSVLQHAVNSNFREGIEILLRETSIRTRLEFEEACVKQNDDIIRLFLDIACERRRSSAEYLSILLEHKFVDKAREFIQMNGFNISDQNLYVSRRHLRCNSGRRGQSPLHVSALFQKAQFLENLIQRGAKLDIKDEGDCTPLYAACLYGSYECCQCLLKHGANPTLNDTTKQDSAARPCSTLYALCQLSEPPVNEDIIGLLLSAGLDMNKELWILGIRFSHHINDYTLCLLMSLCGVPSSLEIMCVRAIRLHLSELTSGGSILARVHELPVPPLLKARLIVSNFDQGLWLSSPTL